jgi:AraC-like DNA-binding protein
MLSYQPNVIDQGITWSLPYLDELRWMKAVYVQHTFKPHSHDYFVLGVIERGLQSFRHEREKRVTIPGNVIVINPGEMHTGESLLKDGFAYRAFYPSVALMQRIAHECGMAHDFLPQFSQGVVADRQLFRQFQRVHRISEHFDNPLAIESHVVHFLAMLLQRHSQPKITPLAPMLVHKAVAQAIDYLETHYATPITLSELSAHVYITPYHLARMFTQHVGMPPHTYLETVRIRRAEQLLKQKITIADIAYQTGFSSQSHLTRTFKRVIGTTPAEYRKIV